MRCIWPRVAGAAGNLSKTCSRRGSLGVPRRVRWRFPGSPWKSRKSLLEVSGKLPGSSPEVGVLDGPGKICYSALSHVPVIFAQCSPMPADAQVLGSSHCHWEQRRRSPLARRTEPDRPTPPQPHVLYASAVARMSALTSAGPPNLPRHLRTSAVPGARPRPRLFFFKPDVFFPRNSLLTCSPLRNRRNGQRRSHKGSARQRLARHRGPRHRGPHRLLGRHRGPRRAVSQLGSSSGADH